MITRQKIMVTGSGGQLGKCLQQTATQYTQFEFVFLKKENLSIQNLEDAEGQFRVHRPQWVINCAAYTQVDKAESEKELAWSINGRAVGGLAELCHRFQSRFIHISTDYVFDGKATEPYSEDSLTDPINVYGASKLEGERLALLAEPDALIIRSSWVYSEFGKNFVLTMRRLLAEKEEVAVVNDQFGSPTYAGDLGEAMLQIIASGKWEPGIYNYCNEGIISWYEFALAIREFTGAQAKINPIPTSSYPTAAKRPPYSALDTGRIRRTYGIKMKPWKESLHKCIKRIPTSE